MKEIFSHIHRISKTLVITGWSAVILMLAASIILYSGAGRWFDYYTSVEISEKLLELVRPVCVTVSIGCIAAEHLIKQKNNRMQ